MKVELRSIVEAEDALMRLFACHPKKSRDTFKLARLSRKVRPVLMDYQTARRETLNRLAVPDPEVRNQFLFAEVDDEGEIVTGEDGSPVINEGARDAFNAEIVEMLDEDIELDIQLLPLTAFDRFGIEPELTPDEMALIWWLIKEAQEEETAE